MGAGCGELDAASRVKIIMVDPIGLLVAAAPYPIGVDHALIEQYGGTARFDRINIVPSISPAVWRHMMMSPPGMQYLSGRSTDIDHVVAQMVELPMVRSWIMAQQEQEQEQEQEHVKDSSEQKQMQCTMTMTMTMTMMRESMKRRMEWERRTGLKEVPEMVAALRDELAIARASSSSSSPEHKLRVMCVSNMTRDELRYLRCCFPELLSMFDAVIISGNEGFCLPTRQLLRIALQRAHQHATQLACPQSVIVSCNISHNNWCQHYATARMIVDNATSGLGNVISNINDRIPMRPPPLDDDGDRNMIDIVDGSTVVAQPFLFLHGSCLQSVVSARSLGLQAALVHDPLQLRHLIRQYTTNANNTAEDAPALQHLDHLQILGSINCSISNSCNGIISAFQSIAHSEFVAKAIARATHYLFTDRNNNNSFQFPSLTSHNAYIYENFSRFLIAELLNDPRFLPMHTAPTNAPPLLHFMDWTRDEDNGVDNMIGSRGLPREAAFMLRSLPPDVDTTSIGLSVLCKLGKLGNGGMSALNSALDAMLSRAVCIVDDILQVYFDPSRPRTDPVVVANAVFLFHLARRGDEVRGSEEFVCDTLRHRAYACGTLYYDPEAFLFYVARLVHEFPRHFAASGLSDLLVRRLDEHKVHASSTKTITKKEEINCLNLAMYMCARRLCGLPNSVADEETLVALQDDNGSWGFHPFFVEGRNKKQWFANQGLTTAFALRALQAQLI